MKTITTEAFEKLIAGRRFGQKQSGIASGRVLEALKLHLVEGKRVVEAAAQAGPISPAAVYAALQKLKVKPSPPKKMKKCPHCHGKGVVSARA